MLAGWLGYQTLTSVWNAQSTQALRESTRQVGAQVLGRLQVADTLLSSWPVPSEASDIRRLPGAERIFRGTFWIDSSGVAHIGSGEDARDARWPALIRQAAQRPGVAVVQGEGGRMTQRSLLLLRSMTGPDAPQVWLARETPQGTWVAEVAPDHLWEPLSDAGGRAHWRVLDAQRRLLAQAGASVREMHPLREHRWTLFLGGEFGAGDWWIEQQTAASELTVAGLPLADQALTYGAIVVLFVGLLSLTQIRRTLAPLQALIDGTQRLANRERAAQVPVLGDDEFGLLARSFNRMSGRIESQIRSLEALGGIDRAIVSGQALPEVLDLLLQQVVARTGARLAAVVRVPDRSDLGRGASWRRQTLLMQWRRAPDEDSVRGHRGLEPCLLEEADRPLWSALHEPLSWPPAEASAMGWQHRLPGGAGLSWWACPARWSEGGRALLLLGFDEAPSARRQHEATDLRDRLSVALAAHEREQTLHWRAQHDDLTGLLNRHGLSERMNLCLSAPQPPMPLALMFVDLDHFKDVNDTLGHEMGDRLLQQAAERVVAVVPSRAIVARAGGDEFVIALPTTDEEAAADVARRLCERLAVPFQCSGHTLHLGASVGIAVAPQHGRDRATLMRHADMAMYQAKQAGRGRSAVFAETLDHDMSERSRLLADLRRAVDTAGEIVLHYQPRVDARDGTIRSAEALVRWQHPELGLLAPGRFIALAEESDLIDVLGLCVLRLACAQMARWRAEGVGLERVSVNVSPRQLASGRLVDEVEQALADHGLDAQALELEITESLLVGDAQPACDQLQRLRDRGVLIALDDFGTGYSSLATLRTLPVDVMKVDRAFVKDLGQDESALAVTRTILTLARSLNKHTVAEGMETAEQARLLQDLGVDEMQGFWFSKPVPPEVLAAMPAVGRAGVGAQPVPARAGREQGVVQPA